MQVHRFPLLKELKELKDEIPTTDELLDRGVTEVHVGFTVDDLKKQPGLVLEFMQSYRDKIPYMAFVWYLSYQDMGDVMETWLRTPLMFNTYLKHFNMWNKWFYSIHLDYSALDFSGRPATHKQNYLQIIATASRAFAPSLRLSLPQNFEGTERTELNELNLKLLIIE